MKQYFFNITFIFSGLAFAQIQQGETNVTKTTDFKDESVTVERVYEPKVEAAQKIKQTPNVVDSSQKKLPVTYGLKDVQAESDFETSTINAEELPIDNKNAFSNYIRLGIGTKNTISIDGYAEHALDNAKKVGATIDYFTTNADIPNAITSTTTSKINAEGFLKLNLDDAQADIRVGGLLDRLNYYGINPNEKHSLTLPNVEQIYKNFYASGKYKTYNHLFLEDVKVKAGYFGDKFNAKETSIDASSKLKYDEVFDINDTNFDITADVNLNLSKSSFDVITERNYRTFNSGVKPMFVASNDLLNLKIGANIQYLNSTFETFNKIYLFPTVEIALNTLPEFGIYGGISGGITQNRLETLYENNPFLLPNQTLKPTITKFDAHAGIRGNLSTNFKYDVQANYKKAENIPFFYKFGASGAPYAEYNSFATLYDDGSISSIIGKINYTGISHLDLGSHITLQKYNLGKLIKTLDHPTLKASLFANYKLLNDKLLIGGDVFFVGSRTSAQSSFLDNDIQQTISIATYNLDPYIDLNLNAHYAFTERWSAFAKLNNLLNNNYERYLNYQVQGLTVIGGIMYKF